MQFQELATPDRTRRLSINNRVPQGFEGTDQESFYDKLKQLA